MMSFKLFFLMFTIPILSMSNSIYIDNLGAKGDGLFDNTAILQSAIDSAHQLGGATVVLSKGIYLSGTIHLKSNVVLHIETFATLKAIPKATSFPFIQGSIPSRMDLTPWKAFIRAENQQNISITGGGAIDGSGNATLFIDGQPDSPERPYGLLFIGCENVKVKDIHMKSSAHWMQRYFNCKGVRIDGITVFNHANKNNDGLDIDSSEDVIVSNCVIDSSDDAIVIKTEGRKPARNIVITNCILATHASAIKLGTGSMGGFENITISNIVIRKSTAKEVVHPLKLENGLTGIDLNTVDGGDMRQVSISNVIMDGLENPIHIRLGNRQSDNAAQPDGDKKSNIKKISTIEGILLSNIQARNMGPYPIVITGFEGHFVKNVTLRDISIHALKPGEKGDIEAEVNWEPHWYPFILIYNSRMPAYGIVTNYTQGLIMENVRFNPAPNEPRPQVLHLNRR